jgi:MGT family glycosyltransferase
MRVLFTTLPGAGPFHPLVPLAQSLQAAGHEVAFACARSYCPTVEAAGFRCFPAGCDWLLSNRDQVYARVQEEVARRATPFSPLADLYARFLPPPMIADLLSLAHAWSPDVLVRDPMEFAGCIAAECLGIPHAACGPLFVFWQGAWHDTPGEVATPDLDSLRRIYGLPPDPALVMLYRYLYLAFLPPAFVGPDLAIPSTVQFLRPMSFNQSGDEGLPAWVTQLPERPTVHASLGTIFHRTPGVFRAILDALRDEPLNVILAVGRDQDPAQFGPQPPNVFIERYIPHSLLLPYCDVVITHGGFSSVMVCLNQGLPMVVMPLAGDQPGNAHRCAALGVGRSIPPDQRTPEQIREAVLEVLGNRCYRARAAQMRDEMQWLPEPAYAVALLEQLTVGKTRGRG